MKYKGAAFGTDDRVVVRATVPDFDRHGTVIKVMAPRYDGDCFRACVKLDRDSGRDVKEMWFKETWLFPER